jgi:hypothetical protein
MKAIPRPTAPPGQSTVGSISRPTRPATSPRWSAPAPGRENRTAKPAVRRGRTRSTGPGRPSSCSMWTASGSSCAAVRRWPSAPKRCRGVRFPRPTTSPRMPWTGWLERTRRRAGAGGRNRTRHEGFAQMMPLFVRLALLLERFVDLFHFLLLGNSPELLRRDQAFWPRPSSYHSDPTAGTEADRPVPVAPPATAPIPSFQPSRDELSAPREHGSLIKINQFGTRPSAQHSAPARGDGSPSWAMHQEHAPQSGKYVTVNYGMWRFGVRS